MRHCQHDLIIFVLICAMSFVKRLREAVEGSGYLHKEIADKANIKKRAFDMYVGGRESMPPADVAVRIAKVLGVTVEYLATGKNPEGFILNAQDRKLMNMYNELDTNDKQIVLDLVKSLADRYANAKTAEKSSASAG